MWSILLTILIFSIYPSIATCYALLIINDMEADQRVISETAVVDKEQITAGFIALNNILMLQMTTYIFSLTLFLIVFIYSTWNLPLYQFYQTEDLSSFVMSSREGLCTEEVEKLDKAYDQPSVDMESFTS